MAWHLHMYDTDCFLACLLALPLPLPTRAIPKCRPTVLHAESAAAEAEAADAAVVV